jgi:hypothetical protein
MVIAGIFSNGKPVRAGIYSEILVSSFCRFVIDYKKVTCFSSAGNQADNLSGLRKVIWIIRILYKAYKKEFIY